MPDLADLHRHLDGSLRPATVAELAAELGRRVPDDLLFQAGMGLDEALARFAFTLSLLQTPAAVRRVAAEICEDASADGVTTLEIRFAPQLHGHPIETVIDAALAGIDGRAGLLLCGLYGEDPNVLLQSVEVGATRADVVGIDLAGGPAPAHTWSLADYAAPYRRAAELGLGRTVHAGEGRDADEIRIAIEVLGATRIGHATTLLDRPDIVELVLDREVTLEACPTSNVHVGAIRSVAEHPLPHWLDRGIRACICTDNTLLSDIASQREHANATTIPGMTPDKLQRAIRCGHESAFKPGANARG